MHAGPPNDSSIKVFLTIDGYDRGEQTEVLTILACSASANKDPFLFRRCSVLSHILQLECLRGLLCCSAYARHQIVAAWHSMAHLHQTYVRWNVWRSLIMSKVLLSNLRFNSVLAREWVISCSASKNLNHVWPSRHCSKTPQGLFQNPARIVPSAGRAKFGDGQV